MLNAKQARKQFLATHKVVIAQAQQDYPTIFEIIEQRLNQAIVEGRNYFVIEDNELDALTFKDHLMYHLMYTLDFGAKHGYEDGVPAYRIGFDNRPDDEEHDNAEVVHISSFEELDQLPDEVKAAIMKSVLERM